VQVPNHIFPTLMDDTHILGFINEITRAFNHLLTQLTLVGVATLVLGSRPKQRGYKVVGQKEAQVSRQKEARESR